MEEIVVSVIIPVYKVEQYLGECVESVLEQDYPFLDIILVDDGSPDACPKLCDTYAEKYPQYIRVLHKENGGLGAARNAGAEIARGSFLMFLDSDDKLDGPGAVSCLVRKAEKTGADIVVGGFRRLSENGLSEVNPPHLHGGSYTKTVDFRFKGFIMYGHLSYDWGKLYRKSFLNQHDLKCCTYPFTQDKAHNMRCLVYEPVYAFVKRGIVQYRVNEFSVTYKYKKNFSPVWTGIAADFLDFLKERGIRKDYGDLVDFHILIGSFFLVKQELENPERGIHGAVEALRAYGRDPIVKKALKELSCGRYVSAISAKAWKAMVPPAALLLRIHGYWLFAAGIALLRKCEIDRKITKSRYQKR